MSEADVKFKGLGDFVTNTMARLHVPGVAVGIHNNGEEYTAGFGVTSIDNPLPVTTDTLFQIGSITKTFTGTAAMRLVEMGKLDLDTPIRTYLPDFRMSDEDAAARVTLRHLFNHTAGWLGDYFDDLGPGDDALAKYVAKMAELPQWTPLGTIWSYNNASFSLAGRVIEAVTGKTYEAAMQELVLDPLGLKMSFFAPADVMTHRFVIGHIYTFEDGKLEVARPWPLARTAHAAGAITATVKDQLRYARFHLGDGTAEDGARLLKKETLDTMHAPLTDAALGDKFGITWFVRDVGGVRIITHGGATKGQMALLMIAPERNFAISILTNSSRGAELNREVSQWALKQYLNAETPAPVNRELTEAQLAPYVGVYQAASTDIELSLRDGELVMQVIPKGGFPSKDSQPGPTPPPSRLAFCGEERVVALDQPSKDLQGEFLRNPDGTLAWFRWGSRIHKRS